MFSWLFGKRKARFKLRREAINGGVKKEKLIRFEGPNGPFYACGMGMGSQPDNYCNFYMDEKYQFFFYVGYDSDDDNNFFVIVHHATTAFRSGGIIYFAEANQHYLEQNIRQIYAERNVMSISRPYIKALQNIIIRFTWTEE